ncbi:sedoheptulose 7-phosphate cyclase [Lysinibacillus halotolerans]|uniref:Iron-containing alcohol dehydrogenase n=1 Tax=Lysinibacillus halotolerans TaxID=1368476 RepID=A0A3M8H4W5_9BACI|nr:sedoheptulose 7-phosphate cyclase [Lysinibacillus halotolerans]RNC97254.1 iron-containing alcohol dehydrogenase [Lysinibacillus halotolerans]
MVLKLNNKITANYKKEFSYDVYFEDDMFNIKNPLIKQVTNNRKLIIIMSKTVERLYYDKIMNYFQFNNFDYSVLTIETGEENKTLQNIENIVSFCNQKNADRKTILIGIGGGILLDMVGFAASMVRRKLDYIRIPTTLVGQIDAGIGIKTGVNFEKKKNYIGSFYPPIACLNDISFLYTLSELNIICGLAEIIKMGIIVDKSLILLIEANKESLLKSYRTQGQENVTINILATIDMLDELKPNFYEENLERLVDFGHTFSPYIEEKSNYEIPHGIAVGLDIALSTEISYLKKYLKKEDRERILKLLLECKLDIYNTKTFNTVELKKSLDRIELHRGGDLNLVVPEKIGSAIFVKDKSEVTIELLQTAINNLKMYQEKYKLSEVNY